MRLQSHRARVLLEDRLSQRTISARLPHTACAIETAAKSMINDVVLSTVKAEQKMCPSYGRMSELLCEFHTNNA